MGNPLYKLKCKECNYELNILEGFSRDKKLVRVFYCSECKEFKEMVFNIGEYQKDQPKICDKCGSELKDLDIKIQQESTPYGSKATSAMQVHCPKCKSANVEIFWSGFWD